MELICENFVLIFFPFHKCETSAIVFACEDRLRQWITSQLQVKSLRRYKNFSKIISTTELTRYDTCANFLGFGTYNTMLLTAKDITPICLYIYYICTFEYMYKILVLAHDLEVGADARISQESARLPH